MGENCWLGKRISKGNKRAPLMFKKTVKWTGEQTYSMLLQISSKNSEQNFKRNRFLHNKRFVFCANGTIHLRRRLLSL